MHNNANKHRIAVFCSSASQVDAAYLQIGREMGQALGDAGFDLLYGGTRTGTMHQVALSAQQSGAHVWGIVPQSMVDQGIANTECQQLTIVEDLGQRKRQMLTHADAFVVLPGGFGTLEEFTEALSARYLGYHHKPIVLVDALGFYQNLHQVFTQWVRQGMANDVHLTQFRLASSVEACIEYLNEQLG